MLFGNKKTTKAILLDRASAFVDYLESKDIGWMKLESKNMSFGEKNKEDSMTVSYEIKLDTPDLPIDPDRKVTILYELHRNAIEDSIIIDWTDIPTAAFDKEALNEYVKDIFADGRKAKIDTSSKSCKYCLLQDLATPIDEFLPRFWANVIDDTVRTIEFLTDIFGKVNKKREEELKKLQIAIAPDVFNYFGTGDLPDHLQSKVDK